MGSIFIVLLLGGVIYILQTPQVTIQITGAPATRFVGNITVDGNAKLIAGPLPATLQYRARHVAFSVLPANGTDSEFCVRIDDHETIGPTGVGGWFDGRRVIPDVVLKPLDVGEFQRLAAQYLNVSQAARPTSPPVVVVPAQDAAAD